MPSNQKDALEQLQRGSRERLKRDYSGKSGTKFATEVRESLNYQYNPADLVLATPAALSILGTYHVATGSPEAASTLLGPFMPNGGWKYLQVGQDPTVKASLVHVADRGMKALAMATRQLDTISNVSRDSTDVITEVVRATQMLSDQVQIARILDSKLNQLRQVSEGGTNYASEAEKEFDSWLLAVTELHTALAKKLVTAEVAESEKLQADVEATQKRPETGAADAAAAKLLVALNNSDAAFQRVNDNVPSGWESCAMEAVNAIAQAGPSIVAQALPGIINGMNSLSALTSSPSALGKAAARSTSLTPATDPAYSAALLLAPFVNSLCAYLTGGTDGSIDWAKFHDPAGVTWLLTNVSEQQKTADLGTTQPSEELKGAFTKLIRILEALKSSSGTAATATITSWQDDIKQAKATVLKLETIAKLFPGTSLSACQMRPAQIDIPNTDSSAQMAVISAATQKLAVEQHSLADRQKTNNKLAERNAKTQKELAAVQNKLKALEFSDSQALEKITSVLASNISIIVQFKTELNKIKCLFAAISLLVHKVVQPKIKSFEDMDRIPEKGQRLLRPTDIAIEIIYNTTLQIKALFDVLTSVARMYQQMQSMVLGQGEQLVWNLSQVARMDPTGGQAKRSRENLGHWAERASEDIFKAVTKKESETRESLGERIGGLDEHSRRVEGIVGVHDAAFVAAMKDGAAFVGEYVEKNIS
ncbi:hypothetical protein B0H63DRAFT_413113 [Podospora didyma]|uniref:Uncharacterized protein n=1 Tax=Podospora didyma TaxID=330526 RepID=A0AAE0NUE4_9PEZI|nr:hypothetical protein B0H63DRAFT_413113 [Podospora didyma]